MAVAEYGKRELNPKWISLVESVSPYKAEKVCNCRKEFSAWKDDNGHVFYRATLCQERDACPVCGRVYTESLVDDAVEVIGRIVRAVGGPPMFASVELTVPWEARVRVGRDDLGKLRKMGWEVLKEVLGVDGEDGNERYLLAVVGAVHYWHSKDPFAGWYPHLHFTVLDVVHDVEKGTFKRIKLFLSPDKLRLLSSLWRRKFVARYGETKAQRFDVHWRYSVGYKHLRHRLSYALRRPVGDLYRAACQSGMSPRVNLEWLEMVLSPPKNEKRVQWYGWLSDGVKSRFLAKLDIVLKKKAERDRERRRISCPICGSELYCFRRGIEYDSLAEEERGDVVLAYGKPRGLRGWSG